MLKRSFVSRVFSSIFQHMMKDFQIAARIRANDGDVGYSGAVRYATTHELFAVHPETGIVTVWENFDF